MIVSSKGVLPSIGTDSTSRLLLSSSASLSLLMRAAMEKLLILMAATAFDLSMASMASEASWLLAASWSEVEEVVEEAGDASSAEMPPLLAAPLSDGGDGMCGVERFGEIILWSVCLSVPSFLGAECYLCT